MISLLLSLLLLWDLVAPGEDALVEVQDLGHVAVVVLVVVVVVVVVVVKVMRQRAVNHYCEPYSINSITINLVIIFIYYSFSNY